MAAGPARRGKHPKAVALPRGAWRPGRGGHDGRPAPPNRSRGADDGPPAGADPEPPSGLPPVLGAGASPGRWAGSSLPWPLGGIVSRPANSPRTISTPCGASIPSCTARPLTRRTLTVMLPPIWMLSSVFLVSTNMTRSFPWHDRFDESLGSVRSAAAEAPALDDCGEGRDYLRSTLSFSQSQRLAMHRACRTAPNRSPLLQPLAPQALAERQDGSVPGWS